MLARWIDWGTDKSPLPYYLNHLIIAAVLGLVFGTPLAGAFFYIGREIRDWEKLGTFDHAGFWWPVVPMFVIWGVCAWL